MTQTPLVHLIQKTSWQTGLVVTACIGYGISLAIFFALKKVPFSHHPISKNTRMLSELKSVFINTQNIFCALYTSLMNLPIYMLGAMWGIPYLLHVGHYSETQAASICGMLFLGVMIGSPLTGIIADLKRSRKMMMILGAFLSIVIMLAILSDYTSYYIDLSLFFFIRHYHQHTNIKLLISSSTESSEIERNSNVSNFHCFLIGWRHYSTPLRNAISRF